ncbi:MAG TPA: hypothetical protein VKB51_14950 [bacterium]|nr:hypothetical protein [bacterium]
MTSALHLAHRTSLAAATLMALAAAVGVVWPSIYTAYLPMPPWAHVEAVGQDVLTLFGVIPLLLLSLRAAGRGSVAGHLVWLGTLAYGTYFYALITFGYPYNPLFMLYTAVLGLSVFSLVTGAMGLEAERVAAAFAGRAPVRAVAGFLMAVGLVFAGLWLADIVSALWTGRLPAIVTRFEFPTAPIYALDLAFSVPALLIGGLLLWRRHPAGYVLGGLMLVLAGLVGAALVAMGAALWIAGQPGDVLPTVPMAAIALCAGVLAVAFLRHAQPPSHGAP